MTERILTVRIRSEAEALKRDFQALKRGTQEFEAGIKTLGVAAAAVSATIGGVFVKGTQSFLEYSGAIKQFGVVTQTTGTPASKELESEVERLGIVTSKTPTEIAKLSVELGKGGNTAEQTTQALEGIVRASEGTGAGLTQTGEIISAVRNQFQLTADQTEKVADVLVATANNSASGVEDLGEAFSYAGAQSKASNQSLDDTAIALGLLANNGIKGSSAGTGLAEALRRLKLVSAGLSEETEISVGRFKNGADAMRQLGVQARDSQGNMRPLMELLPELRAALERFSPGDRDLALNAIFGVQGGRVIQSLLGSTTEKVNQLTGAVKNSGGAARKAGEELLAGAGGALDLLSGSIGEYQGRAQETLRQAKL